MVGGTVTTAFLGMLQGIIIARVLGPEGTGQFQLVLTLSITVSTFLILGLSHANIFFLNHHKAQPTYILINSIYFSALMGSISFVIVYFILNFGQKYTGGFSFLTKFIFSLSVIFLFLRIVIRPILIAQMRVLEYNISQIAFKIFPIFLIGYLAFRRSLTIDKALIIVAFSQVLDTILLLFFLRSYLCICTPDFALLWKTLKYALQLYTVNLLLNVDQNISMVLIGLLMPGEFSSLGYYSRAVAICLPIRLIPQALSNLLYSQWTLVDGKERIHQVERTLRMSILLGLSIVVSIALVGKWLVVLLYGEVFLPCYAPLQILVIQQGFWMTSKVFQSFFSGCGKPALPLYNLIVVNLVSVGGMIILIPRMGMIGAASSLALAHLIYIILNFIQAKKHYNFVISHCFAITGNDITLLCKSLIPKKLCEQETKKIQTM